MELSARDIEIFKLLGRYRYLRSTYIHAFAGGASETRFKERLGDLFHEGYLDRPSQQWELADARCAPVVHELGAGAARVLRDCGEAPCQGWTFLRKTEHRQFKHALMICEAMASLELGARAREALRFIPWPEILARAPEATRALPMPFRLSVPSGGHLTPDGVFGIAYRNGSAESYRFFAVEADRGTMPIARSDPRQTSYLGKLAAYREIVAGQVHKTQWGVPNLFVLTLTTSEARKSETMARLGEGNAAFLFKATNPRVLQAPVLDLLTEPWLRAGHGSLSIAETH